MVTVSPISNQVIVELLTLEKGKNAGIRPFFGRNRRQGGGVLFRRITVHVKTPNGRHFALAHLTKVFFLPLRRNFSPSAVSHSIDCFLPSSARQLKTASGTRASSSERREHCGGGGGVGVPQFRGVSIWQFLPTLLLVLVLIGSPETLIDRYIKPSP